MMGSRMVLSKIIGFVENAFAPNNVKLVLSHAISCPIVSHVDGFGSFLLDRVVGDAGSRTVVGDGDSGRLGPSEFFKGDSDRAGFFTIVEETSEFSFGGTRHDFAHDMTRC